MVLAVLFMFLAFKSFDFTYVMTVLLEKRLVHNKANLHQFRGKVKGLKIFLAPPLYMEVPEYIGKFTVMYLCDIYRKVYGNVFVC